jgi:hypothetical protein
MSWFDLIGVGVVVSDCVAQIVRSVLRGRKDGCEETTRVLWSECGPARGLCFLEVRG